MGLQYNLLQFDPDYSIIRPYLSFGRIASYSISDTQSTEEYDSVGFEYDSRALENVCAHAAAMVRKLERDSNDKSAHNSLVRDYRNAISCLKVGKYGRRETIDNLTKYMLLEDWDNRTIRP